MRRVLTILLGGSLLFGFSTQLSLHAQTCNDDEAMVKSYVDSLTDLVSKVQKESQSDFERAFHQKSCQTKLSLSLDMVDGLLACLDNAAKDTTATKEQLDAINAKRQAYTKLKTMLAHDNDGLKAVQSPKAAKALVEKFTFST